MTEPTFDVNGYPTEETLEVIEGWNPIDARGLFDFLYNAWSYPEMFTEDKPGVFHISTGGWSGNESLISALRNNNVAWALYWEWSRRGGHYCFDLNGKVQKSESQPQTSGERIMSKSEPPLVEVAKNSRPCPFCGSPAVIRDGGIAVGYSIGCEDPDCIFEPWHDLFGSVHLAKLAWNLRADSDHEDRSGDE